MSREVRLELPFPPPELSPNAREGWRKKAAVVADYRVDVGWIAVVARQLWEDKYGRQPRVPLTPPVEASVTFIVPDRRKRDEDNLLSMLKPAWDGLVDAGVLAGDDHERFKVVATSIEVGEPKVIVVLEGAE